MKRYLCIYKGTPEHPGQDAGAVLRLMREMTTAGVLLAAERCKDSASGGRLRAFMGDVVSIQGAQSREAVSGVVLLQVASKDQALEWNKRLLQAFGGGECEIYELEAPPNA